ncbi:hypothetical protein GO988_09315 [Hymenobacter sp. HMF4947]|uniref:Uncharacterized protein n=1 Tax=Hymenobacter ginkgonis TaxID=2682976 RepID=A0A7K1TEE8_9BACT|nr:hypothetical protein [Hymenobacter ginkgonis]MVN76521.1 hypothetical protein [Hymenobacter ginkgonis]
MSDSLLFCVFLTGSLLLGAGLLVAAWRRPDQRRRGLRLLASVAAPLALWLTAYPPSRSVPAARAEAIVLTPGYSPDSLRQLRRRLGIGTPVWSYQVAAPAGAKVLPALLSLAEQRPALRRVHLLGQGVPAADLPALGQVAVVAHAGPAPFGFRDAAWAKQVALGQYFTLEGAVALPPGAAPGWVSLHAAGAGRDSVRVPAGGGPFRLRYQPRAAGLTIYQLQLRQAGRVVATEPVPLAVMPVRQPAVLLLASVPSFEFKFLKNSLAATGRAVGARTTVSRGLVQTEFLNQPTQALDHLTPPLLSRYAVVVADAASLAALPPAEGQTLRQAVQQGRLGLVLLADPTPLPAALPGRASFVVQPLPVVGATPQPLAWPDAPVPVRALLPAHLRASAELQPLITGPGAAVVAAGRRFGLGTVVVSVVPETFRWSLQGQAAAYTSFWSQLLTAATPPPAATATWQVLAPWPRPGVPLALRLAGGPAAVLPTVRPLAGGAAVQLPLAQDPRLPEWRTAQYWPATAGWHQVQGPGAVTHSFYVFEPANWRGPELTERTQALAARPTPLLGVGGRAAVRQPWPAGWFFGLFLLAAGFLWLEEKL